jgi:hypothetical protein
MRRAMETLRIDWILARLASWARRTTPLVGVAVALLALAAIFTNSCSSDADYQKCRAEEQAGQYVYTQDDLCGCERLKCDQGRRCFHGDCCDPQLYSDDPQRCGCAATCNAGEVCANGQCCDPTADTAGTTKNCGCAGPCGDREACQKDGAGVYHCVCDAKLSLADKTNCGCTGQACDPDTERCRNGVCECDPLAGPPQQDDSNCACRGECPFVMENGQKVRTAYCFDGVCHCFSADQVICNGQCVKQADCTCEPAKHQYDVGDCACQGPCASGDACQNGACVCDPVAHATDDLDCGCHGPCDVAHGYHCEQGTCACPAALLSDDLDCGCHGPCDVAHGYHCEQGTCACPVALLSDNLNCGCSGVACSVNLGFACTGGRASVDLRG